MVILVFRRPYQYYEEVTPSLKEKFRFKQAAAQQFIMLYTAFEKIHNLFNFQLPRL